MNPATRTIILDSADRVSGTPEHAILDLGRNIHAERVSLEHFSISNSFYNITDHTNTFSIDASDVTIANGKYDLSELVIAVNDQMPANKTIAHNDITNKITFADGTATNFVLVFPNYETGDLYGFDHTATFSGAASYSSTRPINLEEQEIYVATNIVQGNDSVTSNSNVRTPDFVIPVDVNKNEILFYSAGSDFQQFRRSAVSSFRTANVMLLDRYRRPLNHCGNWTMVFGLHD